MNPHEVNINNQNDFINNATFQYYYEYIKNYIFDLYEFHDKRIEKFTFNDLENICFNLSKQLIETGHVWDYFEIKDSCFSNGKAANIIEDKFNVEFEIVLKKLNLS